MKFAQKWTLDHLLNGNLITESEGYSRLESALSERGCLASRRFHVERIEARPADEHRIESHSHELDGFTWSSEVPTELELSYPAHVRESPACELGAIGHDLRDQISILRER